LSAELETKLTYTFKDPEILQLALRHKSHANEARKQSVSKEDFVSLHNERLEFLGDSVLGLVMSDILSEKFAQVDEGRLSKMRSMLVKEETLAAVARSIALGEYLLLGKGEETTLGRAKESILSSSYEAILGAIYLDGGLASVFTTVKLHFATLFEEVSNLSRLSDTKTQLQELCQAKYRKSPTYQVVSEVGPDHEKMFEVMVSIESLQRYGKGRNKKEAEQNAARFLLENLEKTEEQVAHELN
jgi:ribonuclease-3